MAATKATFHTDLDEVIVIPKVDIIVFEMVDNEMPGWFAVIGPKRYLVGDDEAKERLEAAIEAYWAGNGGTNA